MIEAHQDAVWDYDGVWPPNVVSSHSLCFQRNRPGGWLKGSRSSHFQSCVRRANLRRPATPAGPANGALSAGPRA
jgi:hypothetical protein